MRKYGILFSALLGVAFWFAVMLMVTRAQAQEPPPGCDEIPKDKIVYTRQPRISEQFANWQHWYDGGMPDRFTEADLVIDDQSGTVEVIHDCTSSKAICAAHDGRVSPDGFRIAYTLAEGDSLYSVKTWGDNRLTPAIEFKAVRYSIWIYDTRTKTTQLVERNARMPDWYSDDGLVFASNRARTYAPWSYAGSVYPDTALQIYKAKLTRISQ